MKLVVLMYLRDDDACVERLLAGSRVAIYSRMDVEGVARATGAGGWYGDAPPHDSEMIVAVVPDDVARDLLDAVAECRGVQDPRHPIHALQLPVERETACRCE